MELSARSANRGAGRDDIIDEHDSRWNWSWRNECWTNQALGSVATSLGSAGPAQQPPRWDSEASGDNTGDDPALVETTIAPLRRAGGNPRDSIDWRSVVW